MKKYGFGVDIGGTTVKIGLFETNGTLVDKWEITTRKEDEGSHILEDVAKSIKDKLAEKSIDASEVQGVGVGVPGPVKSDGVVNRCVNLGWGVYNVEAALSELTGFKVKVGNDANVAALGEMWMGGGKGHSNVIMVTLGTGVGGGIIVDGKMISGAHGAGGEIGHITVDYEETDKCGCGKCGCLEQYASATGIVRMAKKTLAKTTKATTLTKFENLTAKDIFDEAKNNDVVAMELVETLGGVLGYACANIAAVADPEVFVIGGGVSKAGQILIDTISRHFAEQCFHACSTTEFALAELGNDAGMYGCMQMILE